MANIGDQLRDKGFNVPGGTGGGEKRCASCGKVLKNPRFDLCWECKEKRKGSTSSVVDSLPAQCFFSTFYQESPGVDKKYFKQELFYDVPEIVARAFGSAGLNPTQFRQLYTGFQGFALPLRNGHMDFERAKERFGDFYTKQVIRQNTRKVVPSIVVDFIEKHRGLILSSADEMLGFYRYLTSILCYFATK